MKDVKLSLRGQAVILILSSVIWCIFVHRPPGKDFYFPSLIEPIWPMLWPFLVLLLLVLGGRFGIREYVNRMTNPFSYYFGILFSALPMAVLASYWIGDWVTTNEISIGDYYYFGSPEFVLTKWRWMMAWGVLTVCLIGLGYFVVRLRGFAILGLLSLLVMSVSTVDALSSLHEFT